MFEQLLYETRFSTRKTVDRVKIKYAEDELQQIMHASEMERQKLIQKNSSIDLSKEDLTKK